MTCIAFANTFLNPDLLVAVNVDAALLGWTQHARFAIIVGMIVLPGCAVAALLPNKRGYRWKLPLKIFINVVSLGMLALNAFSWEVRGETLTSPKVAPPWRALALLANRSGDVAAPGADDDDGLGSSTLAVVNDVLTYGVLILSWLLCLTFAVFFVVFVVFRGAELQKKEEEAQESEDALIATLRAHLVARAKVRSSFLVFARIIFCSSILLFV